MAERVWDRYLTPGDVQHLTLSADRRVGFGERPALIMVDLYRWVYGDRPEPLLDSIKEWPGSCGLAGWNALPATQELLAAARRAQLPIIYLTGLDDAGIPHRKDSIGKGARKTADPDRTRRRYQIIDEVAPVPGDVVIKKTGPSGFFGTPLMAELNRQGIDSLIVCGESTSGCVRATVVDAASYRFRVTVVEDCVFDRHEATHALNLFDMHQKYADVLSLREVLAHLMSITPIGAEERVAVPA